MNTATTIETPANTAGNQAREEARRIKRTLLKPSPFNRTRSERIARSYLEQLADSIKRMNILQPIVARPIDAPAGQPPFEIVAGECRWRAAELAGLDTVPVDLRNLTDLEAREVMVLENTHRIDLHPLEEAEAYEALLLDPPHGAPRLTGYTPEELSARFGKSRTYIYNRLKLLDLVPDARKAFYAGTVSASVAQMIARMPAGLQPEMLKRAKEGWGGEPMSARQAQQYIHEHYMLALSKAPFKITDATLTEAGSCRECPKRTGAAPDLFDDVKSADTCTDPSCYQAKKQAHQARVVEQAKAEGTEVLQGKAAKAVKPEQYTSQLKGYMQLDKVHYNIDGSKPLDKLLGKDAPQAVLLEDPFTKDIIKVVPTDAAMAVLKDKGIVHSTRSTTTSAAEREREAKRKADQAWRQELANDLLKGIERADGFDEEALCGWVLEALARLLWKRLGSDDCKRVEKLLGLSAAVGAVDSILDDATTTGERFHELLLAMLIAPTLPVPTYVDINKVDAPQLLLDVAARFGYDEAALRKERLADLKAATSPKGKGEQKPAPSASKGKPAAPAGKGSTEPVAKKAAGKKAAKPAPSAKADDGAAKAAPAASGEAPAAQVSDCGNYWVGQLVKLKGSKVIGEVAELNADGSLTVATPSGEEGVRNLKTVLRADVIELPNQSPPKAARCLEPQEAWPFPKDKHEKVKA